MENGLEGAVITSIVLAQVPLIRESTKGSSSLEPAGCQSPDTACGPDSLSCRYMVDCNQRNYRQWDDIPPGFVVPAHMRNDVMKLCAFLHSMEVAGH